MFPLVGLCGPPDRKASFVRFKGLEGHVDCLNKAALKHLVFPDDHVLAGNLGLGFGFFFFNYLLLFFFYVFGLEFFSFFSPLTFN